jgi:uncharacterized membrane protein YecN with MAPEG domain
MTIHNTILYAALLAVLFLVLTFRTIHFRRGLRVALGDGGSNALQRAIRAHANFAEYVPIAILLLALVEAAGGSVVLMHALGGALLLGRLLHALGISRAREPLPLRMVGMVLTTGVIAVSAVCLLLVYFRVAV